jgi:DNA-binding GntR family transcriptional regulator
MLTFNFDANKHQSKTQLIADVIRQHIESGQLPGSHKLPSITAFSCEYEVARDTVEKAYKRLKNDGYIVSVACKGFFVAER